MLAFHIYQLLKLPKFFFSKIRNTLVIVLNLYFCFFVTIFVFKSEKN